ncbi:MAG: hypothetical protein HYX66_08850 [Ignavibacteria bacterium]|nr:hypothetical protein [Ignavibacteria bacterium]
MIENQHQLEAARLMSLRASNHSTVIIAATNDAEALELAGFSKRGGL